MLQTKTMIIENQSIRHTTEKKKNGILFIYCNFILILSHLIFLHWYSGKRIV